MSLGPQGVNTIVAYVAVGEVTESPEVRRKHHRVARVIGRDAVDRMAGYGEANVGQIYTWCLFRRNRS